MMVEEYAYVYITQRPVKKILTFVEYVDWQPRS